MKKKVNVWKLYEKIFKEGDEVIIVTDDDKFDWGELITTSSGICLTRRNYYRFYPFDDIIFMAHEGFPVKKVRFFMDGQGLDLDLDMNNTEHITKAIRTLLMKKYPKPQTVGRHYYRGGDPYEYEFETVEVINLNSKLDDKCSPFSELLLLKNQSLTGMYFHLPYIYGFEGVN